MNEQNFRSNDPLAMLCLDFLRRAEGNQYFSANRDFLFVHPQLLSDEIDAFLIANSSDPHSSPIAYAFARMRILLQRCKEIGIDEAFNEERIKELSRAFMGNGQFGDKESFVREHAELLTDQAHQVLTDSALRQKSAGAREIFESVRDLLRRCREIGITEAFAEYRSGLPQRAEDSVALISVVQRFMAAPNDDARRDLLMRHPELLTLETEAVLNRYSDSRVARYLEPTLALLRKCRSEGVEETFKSRDAFTELERLHALAGEYLFAETVGEKKRLVELHEELTASAVQLILEQFSAGLDASAQEWVRRHRKLLVACRNRGIDAAFARYRDVLAENKPDLTDNYARGMADLIRLTSESELRPELIPDVIATCLAQLSTISRESSPREFVVLNMALGQAYLRLPSDAVADPWTSALKHFSEALDACDESDQPVIFANLNMEIARLLAQLPFGDRYANQLRAQRHNFSALRAWRAEEAIDQVVGTMLNIANLFGDFVGGDVEVNTEAAVAHCREALHVLQTNQRDASIALTHLGGAYFQRHRGRKKDNILEAIKCFREAANNCNNSDELPSRLLNLGSSLLEYSSLSDGGHLTEALHCLNSALEKSNRNRRPIQFAYVQLALARAYRALDPALHYQNIVDCYSGALAVLNLRNDPDTMLRALIQLGGFYGERGEWPKAWTSLSEALMRSREMHEQGLSRASKKNSIDQQAELFATAAYAAAKVGNVAAAVDILDLGKARLLGENLLLHAARPKNIPDSVWGEYYTASYMSRQTEWEESHEVTDYARLPEITKQRKDRLANAIAQVRRFDGGFLTASTIDIISRDVIDERTAIVTFCCTAHGSMVFVLLSGQPVSYRCIPIPSFSRRELVELFTRNPDENGYAQDGWVGSLTPYLKHRTVESLSKWMSQISETLEQLGRHLFLPALQEMPETVEKLIIVPSHELYLLPLQAIPLPRGGVLIDRYDVCFAPSLQLLAHCSLHSDERRLEKVLVVTNPREDADLAFAEYEGRAVSECFGSAVLLDGSKAKREAVVRSLSEVGIAHFCCHGVFEWAQPRRSGLLMKDGILTVDDLLLSEITLDKESNEEGGITFATVPIDLSRLHLVTISACESGVSNVMQGSPSEYLAIASGFMLAGVPSVLSSLWAVSDFSTALFMEKFYAQYALRRSVPRAAREAAVWLKGVTAQELSALCSPGRHDRLSGFMPAQLRSRAWRRFAAMDGSEKPYEHPYYWAAFSMNGV